MIKTEVKTFLEFAGKPVDEQINQHARKIGKDIKSVNVSHSINGTLTAIVIFEKTELDVSGPKCDQIMVNHDR